MTKAKTNGKSKNAEKAFDIELFEKENFEYVKDGMAAQKGFFVQEQEIDIKVLAGIYAVEDSRIFFRDEQEEAHWAQAHINSANQKIRELQEEITKQKVSISKFNCLIQNYKRLVKSDKLNKRGRPTRSENREQIAREITQKWVASLMESLGVKSCGAKGGLEKVISSTQERNWRRWLSGDAIPSYSTFENLLDAEITCGKYAGGQLFKVPVTPTHDQVLTLLQFI